jgi:guanyl-specific ribonuclease Sa
LVALVVLVVVLAVGYGIRAARETSAPHVGTVALSALPPQAAQTIALIRRGGPFPFPRNDGVVFHNDEHRLPAEPDGYYHEYTVPTPGADDRGTRRVITARDGRYYWTPDHYGTFRRIEVDR